MSEYQIVEYNGKSARQYPDGTIRNERGAILKISQERAFAMQQARRIKAMQAAAMAIKNGTGSDSVDAGVVKLLQKRVEVAMTNKERPGNDAAKLVLQVAGYLTNERKVDVSGNVNHGVSPASLPKEYLDYLRMLAEREQAIEGTVKDEKPE